MYKIYKYIQSIKTKITLSQLFLKIKHNFYKTFFLHK